MASILKASVRTSFWWEEEELEPRAPFLYLLLHLYSNYSTQLSLVGWVMI